MGMRDAWAKKEKAFVKRKAGPNEVAAPPQEMQSPQVVTPRTSSSAQHGAVTHAKMELLEREVKKLRASAPRLLLDPTIIHPSSWANRHESSFSGPEFEALKAEIKSAKKNVQPIKVRPLPDKPDEYEIVFGHRRHRACLELGLQVEAIVEQLDDQALFVEMDRENRLRADLRPYEQGVMYRKAIDRGLFPNPAALALGLGVDKGNVSKVLQIAELPEVVLDAFRSRLAIQYRWGTALKKALDKGIESSTALLSAAKNLAEKSKEEKPSDKEIFRVLMEAASPSQPKTKIKPDLVGHSMDVNGVIFRVAAADVTQAQIEKITAFIQDLLGSESSD